VNIYPFYDLCFIRLFYKGIISFDKSVRTPGAAGAPTSNTALMPMGRSIVKYPIDLDNFIVQTTPFAQTPANIITGAALGNHITPPALFTANGDEIRSTGTNGIIKEPNTTNYYLLAQQQRFLSAITDEGNDSLGALYSPLMLIQLVVTYLMFSTIRIQVLV